MTDLPIKHAHQASHGSAWSTAARIAFAGFLAIAFFFLLAEHRAHLFGALPLLILFACPLLHIFHHGGHGHGSHGGDTASAPVPKPGEDSERREGGHHH